MELASMHKVRGMVAALCLVAGQAAMAQSPDRVPIEAFFQFPSLSGATISPTGRQLAILSATPSKRQELLIVDTMTLEGRALASYKDADVVDVHWVNDHRVVFLPTDLNLGIKQAAQQRLGLLAVDVDGKDLRRMKGVAFLSATRRLDSDRVIVLAPKTDKFWNFETWTSRIVDTRAHNAGMEYTDYDKWLGADTWIYGLANQPAVIAGFTANGPFRAKWDAVENKWRSILEPLEGGAPIAIAPDGTLLVNRREASKDKTSLWRFDLSTLRYDDKPLLESGDHDIDATAIMDDSQLLGVRYRAENETTVWFDQTLAAIQRDVDAALPGRTNTISAPWRPAVPVVLVESSSGRDPGSYYIFHTDTRALEKVGDSMPSIDPRRMGSRGFVRYKARDGLEIPAWLTLPAGAARDAHLPMVVLVHGGPWIPGAIGRWDPESQFLASRGYAVLEPQFRGTTGYGQKHYMAGIKQWGLAMQDDLADGARWAIAQGVADPARICIAGESYGGYASLMGLVKDPDLFKCAVDASGPTDIDLLYGAWFSDLTDRAEAIHKVLTADRDKDAEQIRATSPLQLADKIRQPVLLAYGGEDKRVPITHGRRFKWALPSSNPDVEWIEYPEEGHGLRKEKNRVDFWGRVEAFLGRHIGPGVTTPAK